MKLNQKQLKKLGYERKVERIDTEGDNNMSKIKEVFENTFTGIIAIVLILVLVLSGISFISGVTSTAKSKYLIRAESYKYYTDDYQSSGDWIFLQMPEQKRKFKFVIVAT